MKRSGVEGTVPISVGEDITPPEKHIHRLSRWMCYRSGVRDFHIGIILTVNRMLSRFARGRESLLGKTPAAGNCDSNENNKPDLSQIGERFGFLYGARGVAETVLFRFTVQRTALRNKRTFPRAKNCSPALNFYTSVPTGAALSSPFLAIKNTDTSKCVCIFWCARRDLNPHVRSEH